MKKFKKVYIEITNVCNLQCEFCPKTNRDKRFMTIDEFSYILDEVKDFTDYLYFHVKGEPLLHPHIDEFLEISYDKGFKVNITTNGTLLSKVGDKLLNKLALRQINISLHSFDGNNEMENKDSYLDNIFNFIKSARDNKGLIIALRLWNLTDDNLINKKANKNKEILDRIQSEFNLPFKVEDTINPQRGLKIEDRIYLNQDSEFIWPDLNNEDFGKEGYCYGLRNQMGVLVDGTVIPCCLDGEGKISLGNIYNNSLKQVLSSNRARDIYEGFSKRLVVEEMCRKCGYRRRFNL
ncbi:radical SAM/SPASM domain-containing protein [Tissierella sp. MB52-C2]|uniref:radical SAM/SPASM domain-containing protein n=1 Tax=Tissierella sp. MB52-C2 TaxID=3070999 RepID=UPI00280B81FA|nr:radical SAM/SPASM domain-containing protein [Tissierella sp. MB52-C2]WMM26464.1 radical SAM/SPASM domain-containing protein [Tissierella sp. MB52-C2]